MPLGQRLGLLQPGQKLGQRIDKPGELAERQPLLTLDIGVGQDTRHRFAVAHGKAKQHAAQAEQPAVAGHGRQLETDGVAVIQTPADTGLLHPDPQLVELVVIELETTQHGGHLENGEQLPRTQAGVGQPEQGEEALQQRALLTRRPIRYRKRDLTARPKHCLNVWAVAVHIRHHHHHIFRGEGGILFEQRQQPVVQHFEFAHRAVASMDLQGSIRRIDRALVVAAVEIELTGASLGQLQHILLDGAQQADIAFAINLVDIDEGLDLRHLQLHQLVQVVAPQLAHGGEQRVGGALQGLKIGAGLELVLQPSQGLAIQQVPPVVAAGVGDEQMHLHLGSAAEGQQGLHIARRQRRDAEYEDPLRQPARQLPGALQLVDKLLVEVGSVVAARGERQGAGHQLAPQLRLPILTAHLGQFEPQSLPLLPAGDPVRPVDQILVKEIRYLLAELPQPNLFGILGRILLISAAQISGKRGKGGAIQQGRQNGHQLPAHGALVVGALARHIRQHPGEHLPDKAGGQRKVDIGGDAEGFGQLQLEPLGHARTLHQDLLPIEGVREGRLPDAAHQQLLEQIQLIGVVEGKHGRLPPIHKRG